LLFHTSRLNFNAQIKPWILFIRDVKEETILERQVLEVVLVMSSSCIKDLGKLMGKLIMTLILFLTTLELNIIHREKKKEMQLMWDDRLIRRWLILPKCKSSSPSQMKIALLITMWNAIVFASQNKTILMY